MKKQVIISIIVTAIICITGTSYAAYKLKAEQVSFDNNKLLESNDVQGAIDELSNLASVQINKLQTDVNNINEKMNNLDFIFSLCNGQKIDENTWYFSAPFAKLKTNPSTSLYIPIDLSKYQVTVKGAGIYGSPTDYTSYTEILDYDGIIGIRLKQAANLEDEGMIWYHLMVVSK